MPAHMIPKNLLIEDYNESSKEDFAWRALSKLPEDYYVFHSVHQVSTVKNQLESREIDFLVVNPSKGMLVIECKAGTSYKYEDRRWQCWDYKIDGYKTMAYGGPYKQAESAMREYRNAMQYHEDEKIRDLRYKLNFFHAVWFLDFTLPDFKSFPALPEEADIDFTLLKEDLIDPTKKIEKIFSLLGAKKTLEEDEFSLLLNKVLCPKLELVTTPMGKRKEAQYEMNQLLHEQCRILDFLEEQPCAVIKGAAGTGKTMVALEKAKRHSVAGDRVLFLCYNRLLRNKLENEYKKADDKELAAQFKNVDFYTISKLAKDKTRDFEDFEGLKSWLEDCYYGEKEFGYKHVIIDEGQDFAMIDETEGISKSDAKRNCSLINTLQDVVLEGGGTFYLFYDSNQMIEGRDSDKFELPDCIQNADCRLTLRTNCRNTMEIASTSMKPLKDSRGRPVRPKTICSFEEQDKPFLHLVDSEEKMIKSLHRVLDSCEKQQLDEIVILTLGSLENSCLGGDMTEPGTREDDGFEVYAYKGLHYRMTTSRKFKGLEADAIIIIDLNKDSFVGKPGMNFYVGSSRAKYRLDLICDVQPEDYYTMAASISPNAPHLPLPKKMAGILGSALEAEVLYE